MTIPYRTRQALLRGALILLVVLGIAALVWGGWIFWLSRYVIYTDQGAKIDFSLPEQVPSGVLAQPPELGEPIVVQYNDVASLVGEDLAQIVGYYIEDADLKNNMEQIKSQIKALPAGTAVMVNVKNIQGSFYYSSDVSENRAGSIDVEAMDELLKFLRKSGMYTIACFPSLRDRQYGLHHTNDGIHHSSRGYLWQDDTGCYWLNPATGGTLNYLTQTVNELKNLGFNEVVLSDFSIPVSDNIYFDGDRTQVLTAAARTIVTSCATDSFAVSFMGSTPFTLPEGRCRLFVQDVEPSGIAAAVEKANVSDPLVYVVFVTPLYDTRFEAYSVMRPLSGAH